MTFCSGLGTLAARGAAVEQPAFEARRILKTNAAIALQPRCILDLLFLRRIVKPDSLRVGEHELHPAHRVGRSRLLPQADLDASGDDRLPVHRHRIENVGDVVRTDRRAS